MRGLIVVLALALAACAGQPEGDSQRFPVSSDYPPGTMEHASYTAPNGWRISTLQTPARPDATWKVVILTGTPSWNEYWAPTIAAAPASREVIVANRPGFRDSDPDHAVTDLTAQVEALAPMLETRPGERVLLIGQSFGAPIATLMAVRYSDKVQAVVLVSPYFGDRGPTARRLIGVGSIVQGMLPRDLKHGVAEIRGQEPQLPAVWTALAEMRQPLVFIHGDADTFVPLSASQRIANEYRHTLISVPGGDHFLNACCVDPLWEAIEHAIAEAEGRESAEPPPTPALASAP
ncbi:MAG: alpha/beta fold hydrolase [Hyphomonadaceae bacterium]|nr:alpha/beta fold hydrolase [Hyphomonadaceae bacterium]